VGTLPYFNQAKLAAAIEALTADELDMLPFGVIGLDPSGIVRVYNKTEAQLSGRKGRPTHGQAFFTDIAPCMNNEYFRGRIDKARLAGTLDIAFSFVGDFSDRNRELSVRVQSAADGGLWIFHHRAPNSDQPNA
jgi:photoactive yellow protein